MVVTLPIAALDEEDEDEDEEEEEEEDEEEMVDGSDDVFFKDNALNAATVSTVRRGGRRISSETSSALPPPSSALSSTALPSAPSSSSQPHPAFVSALDEDHTVGLVTVPPVPPAVLGIVTPPPPHAGTPSSVSGTDVGVGVGYNSDLPTTSHPLSPPLPPHILILTTANPFTMF